MGETLRGSGSRRTRIGALVLATSIGAALSTTNASAADECIQSYEQTQTLRRAGKLREARDEAAKCARDSCPAVLSKECAKWMGELDQSIPTVVFEVKSGSGEEITAVKVLVDGKPLVESLDGKAIPLDVGAHTFRFEPVDPKSGKAVEQKVVIHEGDKNKRISASLGGAAATSPKTDGGERPVPLMAYVFGGAAVASLGLGTVFAIVGSGKESDLDACKPRCSADEVNSASSSYALADIFLTAGVVSAIAGVYIFLSRPTVERAALVPGAVTPRPRTGSIKPMVSARGVGFSF